LPIVGDFFQRAQRSRLVDSRVKFDTAQEPGWFAERTGRLREWLQQLFAAAPVKPEKPVATRGPGRRAPVAPVEPQAAASAASAVTGGEGGARALPPLLPAPGSVPAPASAAVDGEARGGGAPAIAPTPTPDDVMPPDARSQGGEGASANGSGASQ
jgi:penicillin-binding protein 1A